MSLRLPLLAGLLLGILLQGCHSLSTRPSAEPLPLLPPLQLAEPLQVNQRLNLHFASESRQLLAVLLLTADHVQLLGLSPTGHRLISISYDGQQLHSEYSEALDGKFPDTQILSLVQLSYWPLEALQAAYSGPWSLRSSARQRRLYLEQEPWITVTYVPAGDNAIHGSMPDKGYNRQPRAGEKITINYHAFDMTLEIITLQVASAERPRE